MEEAEYDAKIKTLKSNLKREQERAQELERDVKEQQELHGQRLAEKNKKLDDLRKDEQVHLRRFLKNVPWRLNPDHTVAEQAETILEYNEILKTFFKCPVCRETTLVSVLKCGHLLCTFCFHHSDNNKCPMGRCEIARQIQEPK